MEGKSFVTNLIDFYDEMTVMVGEGRAVNGVLVIICKVVFNSMSCNILTEKLMKCGLNIWTVRCIEN